MATVAEIAAGLAGALETVTGLRVDDFVPESVNPPAAFVNLGEMTEETFAYETMEITFELVVLTSRSSARVGQGTLYEFASHTGDRSIWRAIADNKDLDLGDGTEARVTRYRPLSIEEIAAYVYFGGAFEIVVTTPT